MSKAFTSEETEESAPLGRAPPRAGESRPITQAGKAALEAELRALHDERANLTASEKALRKDELLRREELLAATLATVHVVSSPTDLSRVSFGCTVEVEDEQGHRRRYTLVGPDETDARSGRISIASPLARALLEQSVGDEVELERPRGVERVTVRAISADRGEAKTKGEQRR